jgi:DNA replication and repair protein RecF
MIIHHLSLSGFRFFQRLELSFPSHINMIVGRNAQGKTSVLEAIHFLSLLTSPLAGHDREMVNFREMEEEIPVGRVTADVIKKEKAHHIEARLILNKNGNGNLRLRKEVLIDGVQRKLLDAVGFFNSVLFLPQMTRIIEDGPSERRKYLDRTISQAHPGYVRALATFNQAITRRNALLKQLGEQGGSADQLVFWDELIAENGALIVSLRTRTVEEMNTVIQSRHTQLTNGLELSELRYLPSLDEDYIERILNGQSGLMDARGALRDLDAIDIKVMYLEKLQTLRNEEIRRGVTTIGPHRDDLLFSANGVDLGVYGSRGQIRTAVMALKLAEVQWLEEKTGEVPVLLLDETLAELDEERRSQLLAELADNSQSIMTTTDLDLFDPDFVAQCVVWHLQDGVIREG